MKKYPKMKDSGIDWIEDIPERWKVGQLRFFGKFISGTGFPHEFQGETSGDYPFYKVSDTNKKNNEIQMHDSENWISEEIRNKLKARIAPKNSVLFPKIGAVLLKNKRRILTTDSIFDNNMMAYSPDVNKSNFWYYHLSLIDFKEIANPGPVPSLNDDSLKEFRVLVPSLIEQEKISAFLEVKTIKIKNEISKNQKLVELLKEKRHVIINNSISKGLDPNAPMKESMNKFFGKIPKNWHEPTIKILKQMQIIFEFQDGNHGELHPKGDDFSIHGTPFLTANQIGEYGEIDFENAHKLPQKFCEKLRIGFAKANDVFFTHNATVGRVAIMPKNAPDVIIGTSITYYRLNDSKLDRTFFANLLKSDYISLQYEPIMKQSTRNQFSILKQAELRVLLPPIEEQILISKFIENKTVTLTSLITKTQLLIQKLQELHQSLISSTVTGKIDVREAVA